MSVSELTSVSDPLKNAAYAAGDLLYSGASTTLANPVVSTALGTLATKSAVNTVYNWWNQKSPNRPSESSNILIPALHRKNAWIDYQSVGFCCTNDILKASFSDLKIKPAYSRFITTSDFILLCELPISASEVSKNNLLLDETIYDIKANTGDLIVKQFVRNIGIPLIAGIKTIVYSIPTSIDSPNLETSTKGVSDVFRITDVLKSSTKEPALTIVINSGGILGKNAFSPEDSNNSEIVIVFIKHLLRNMAVVYADGKCKNLQPQPLNVLHQFSENEIFNVPTDPSTGTNQILYIFRNKLLSFWKKVVQGESSYYLHFQVLLQKVHKIVKLDVIIHEDNSFETLNTVRKNWIHETFLSENASMAKQGIWNNLVQEASSQSLSLTDATDEYKKLGNDVLDKAIEMYKIALVSEEPAQLQRSKEELHKVVNNLLLDSLKSDGNSSLQKNMYIKLTDLAKNGDLILRERGGRKIRRASPLARIPFEEIPSTGTPFGLRDTSLGVTPFGRGRGGGGPVFGGNKKSRRQKPMKKTIKKQPKKRHNGIRVKRISKAKKRMMY
jgi:hypothetical protein